MAPIDDHRLRALATLRETLEPEPVTWALTGSTSFALQGVPVEPGDIDIQTSREGAYAIAECFAEDVVEPVSFSATDRVRSHFGRLVVAGVPVEVMGGVQKRRRDGTWEPPVDVAEHRETVDDAGITLPVLSIEYEAHAYERLGRPERAALLAEHA